MTQSIQELERDIEESRAKLDLTIERLQDKLSVSGMVDDMMGSVRRSRYASVVDEALEVVRRNPVPVMLIAAGVGLLLHRLGQTRRPVRRRRVVVTTEEVPVMNTGQARVYDPDVSPRHPNHDVIEHAPDLSVRA
jgi:ElaB/YqjD/DUF883 family membrane-anchored ribosome-binding protein